jgi:hypothetical protein
MQCADRGGIIPLSSIMAAGVSAGRLLTCQTEFYSFIAQ